ncbi:MAG: alpha/beta fold hydrolase [Verrucomicrobiales bacterium]
MIWALHGNVGAPEDWAFLADACPGEIPLRNIPLWPSLSRATPSLGQWGAQFAAEVRLSEDPHPILLGYSLGGRLALEALIADETLWAGALFVSTHPGILSGEERRDRLARDRQWAEVARSLPWQDFLNRWNAQGVLTGSPPSPHQSRLEPWREQIATAFDIWSLGRQSPFEERIPQRAVPMMWITGELDHRFSSRAADMVRCLPSGRHEVFPKTGHRILLEQPALLSKAVHAFIQDLLK